MKASHSPSLRVEIFLSCRFPDLARVAGECFAKTVVSFLARWTTLVVAQKSNGPTTNMNHRVLLFGASGQIGWELHRRFRSLGDVSTAPRSVTDATRSEELNSLFSSVEPTVVLNAAAYTAVDLAEQEQDTAMSLNGDFPARLAALAKDHDALLVDYSTDYVFDGLKQTPYRETDSVNPINHYGLTKLNGLRAIEESGCRHLVFRVSWVYSSRRKNFLRTILRLAESKDSINVVSDQIGIPTSARWIAEKTAAAVESLDLNEGCEGVYNLAPDGQTSWHGFASRICEWAVEHAAELTLRPESINAIKTKDYPTPAQRPANSRLCMNKVQTEFGFELPDWESLVPSVLQEAL